ncbi:MAG: hypothetical protein ACRBFS_25335 [Aureispira sp.]
MNKIEVSKMITGIVSYLGEKQKRGEPLQDFISQFDEGTQKWLHMLFFTKDGVEKETFQTWKEKLDSSARREAIESLFKVKLEDEPRVTVGFINKVYTELTIANQREGDTGIENIIITGNNSVGMNRAKNNTITYGTKDK